ncbi:hypothetical protein Cph01nite_06110 [Cellulomonas phragmiteti]|uniref:Uncharacterized protein n=1 Tax=Cellulomonas phragmiteti TaxID=478780 RepID=A0ABQ4DHP5_9CELL|nr:hypothetical protein Cph01nite_06110 [Cellulomonas phragmiteti]
MVAVAFLWPAQLGGCTSLAVVPPGVAGPGLAAGDLVVTRCGAPDVGDRVVLRAPGAVWSVGHVVERTAPVWQVRGPDGTDHLAPGEVVDVLPLRIPVTTAAAAPTAAAALTLGLGTTGWLTVRRRRIGAHDDTGACPGVGAVPSAG